MGHSDFMGHWGFAMGHSARGWRVTPESLGRSQSSFGPAGAIPAAVDPDAPPSSIPTQGTRRSHTRLSRINSPPATATGLISNVAGPAASVSVPMVTGRYTS